MESAVRGREELEEQLHTLIYEVSENPRDVNLLVEAGMTAYDLGRRPEAFLYLSRALENDPAKRFLLPKLRECANPEQAAKVAELARRPASFLTSLGDLWLYPFRGSGLGMLILGAIFLYGIRVVTSINVFPVIALFVGVIVFSYFCMWFIDVFRHSSTWRDDLPGWPDPTSWPLLVGDWTKVVSAQVAAFLPLIIMTVVLVTTGAGAMADEAGDPDFASRWDPQFVTAIGLFALVLAAWGLFYLPMALMVNCFYGSTWLCWNPDLVLRSVWRIRREYLLCAAAFAATWILAFVFEALIGGTLWVFIAGLPLTFLELYVMVVQMRLLGVLYRMTQGRLEWNV